MPAPYRLRIITREKVAYDGQVDSVMAPGSRGSLGIWAHHAALITALVPGRLWFREPGGNESSFRLQKGFLEVRQNVVTILTDELGKT
ncbi:MAG: ATP synthase F1 subunit epsilon [Planctomycetes bacterium]|nr:ATP synthase F1 subunit epsilon [Planctomycetota bacterium]